MNYVIIVAGGSGKRFSKKVKKQFLKIDNETILEKTLSKFNNHKLINSIVLVLPEDNLDKLEKLKIKFNKIITVVKGGTERKYSVFNGLTAIKDMIDDNSKILIHDAVRPFVSNRLITNILDMLEHYENVIPAVSVEDTLKEISSDNFVIKTVNRNNYLRIQTPQGFRLSIYEKYEKIIDKMINFTDDSMVAEYFNDEVKVIKGEKSNVKITTVDDLSNFH